MENTGLLVYCVAGRDAAGLDGISGLDGVHRLRSIGNGGLFAVASEVDLGEYGEEGMAARSEDVAWITEKAGVFMDILLRVHELAPCVPIKFMTLFTAEERVRAMLEAHRDALVRDLERTRDREEWSVKVYCDDGVYKDRAAGGERAVFEKSLEGKPKGAVFFLRKKFESQLDERIHDRICEEADRMAGQLTGLSDGMKAGKLLARELSGVETPMVLNCAFLVSRAQREAFTRRAGELDREGAPSGFRVTRSGPWPPFSFCGTDG